MLQVKGLTVRFGSLAILQNLNFSVQAGQWLMLTGPNGAGKSTAVHAISRGVAYEGAVLLRGRDIATYKASTLARDMGILSQHHAVGYSFTVEEIVRLGRFAHGKGFLHTATDADEAQAERALALTGMRELRQHSVLTLSGGELQRTFLAQLFAQDPKLLILDEPSNHLDLVFQKQIFDLLRDWLQEGDRAVISVVHDLSLAKAYGSHALLLHRGNTIAQGAIDEVFTRENLCAVYQMDVHGWMRDMLSQWD